MFSKALFKQSCKANGTMWSIITFAVCFMLACVMLISGSGNIGEVKNSIQDTIITEEVDAQMEKRGLNYYVTEQDGLQKFDVLFAQNVTDTLSYLQWCAAMPNSSDFVDATQYYAALQVWQNDVPQMQTEAGAQYAEAIASWQSSVPVSDSFESTEQYLAALQQWKDSSPATQEQAITVAYAAACEDLQAYVLQKAKDNGYEESSAQAQETLGSVMYALNPNGTFDDFYTQNGEVPPTYDVTNVVMHVATGDASEFVLSEKREDYRLSVAENCSAIFLAGNMLKEENVKLLTDALSDYGVTKEKFDSFGYTYDAVKHMAATAIVTYQGRLGYEIGLLKEKYADTTDNDYLQALEQTKLALQSDVASSFLSTLPQTVSDALEEVGKADLYTLIVGSIFYKLAGLLLPIIYMIMSSNNLIAGQVDSGSMAYVLSTSTKRITVVFTQAVYLVGSLFAMFCLTTATGCVCLSVVSGEVDLTYGNLLLLNLGAFLVLFALSGLCFFTSCVFDRSKRSMAVGGGLSIFALVAAMLGLFGSPVIPSVVRLEALNYFNYATIISLFDVISVMSGTHAFVWKFAILAVCGVVGYVCGSARFIKKDLPL